MGDLRTAALIGRDGSLDGLCLPRFDSPSLFPAILDAQRGGCFRIAPCAEIIPSDQLYLPGTNILITRFLAHGAVVELTDFMPVQASGSVNEPSRLVRRRLHAISGTAKIRLRCNPAFDFASEKTETIEVDRHGAVFRTSALSGHLAASGELQADQSGVAAEFTLKESEKLSFILSEQRDHGWEPPTISERLLDNLEAAPQMYLQRPMARTRTSLGISASVVELRAHWCNHRGAEL